MRCGLVAATILALAATHAPAQWELLPSPTTAGLRGIHALGNGIAWASGTGGTVLRTTDDGAHWQLCPTPPAAEHLDFRGIQAFDAQTAIVMSSGKGDLSRLYKTTDGCATWKLLFTNPDKEGFWDAFQASTPTTATILGDSVSSKTRLWAWDEEDDEPHNSLDLSTTQDQASFAASNSVLEVITAKQVDPVWNFELRWVAGDAHAVGFGLRRAEQTSTCEPCRGQILWVPIPFMAQGTASSGIFSFAFRDQLVGIAVGGDYKKPDSSVGNSALSADGGMKWSSAQTPPRGYRSAVTYSTTTKTWITVGPNGTDISTDDGRNWRALNPDPSSGEDRDWNALSLPFVVGPHGRIGRLRPNALAPAPTTAVVKP